MMAKQTASIKFYQKGGLLAAAVALGEEIMVVVRGDKKPLSTTLVLGERSIARANAIFVAAGKARTAKNGLKQIKSEEDAKAYGVLLAFKAEAAISALPELPATLDELMKDFTREEVKEEIAVAPVQPKQIVVQEQEPKATVVKQPQKEKGEVAVKQQISGYRRPAIEFTPAMLEAWNSAVVQTDALNALNNAKGVLMLDYIKQAPLALTFSVKGVKCSLLLVLEDRTVYVDGRGFGVNTAIPVERNFRSNLFREVTVPLMNKIRPISEPAWLAIKSAMGTWSSNPLFSEGALFAPTEAELRERIGAEIASVALVTTEQTEATTEQAATATEATVTAEPATTQAADLAAILDEEEPEGETSKTMLEILQQEAVASPPEQTKEATGAETPEQEPKREWGGKLQLNLEEFEDILNDLD